MRSSIQILVVSVDAPLAVEEFLLVELGKFLRLYSGIPWASSLEVSQYAGLSVGQSVTPDLHRRLCQLTPANTQGGTLSFHSRTSGLYGIDQRLHCVCTRNTTVAKGGTGMLDSLEFGTRVIIASGIAQALMTLALVSERMEPKNSFLNKTGWMGWLGVPFLLLPLSALPASITSSLWIAGFISTLGVASGCFALADRAAHLLIGNQRKTYRVLATVALWAIGASFVVSTYIVFSLV